MNTVFSRTDTGSDGDRLGFALVMALAFHALIIFGIGFSQSGARPSPSLEITLARHQSRQAPDEADYLARSNQQGSGAEDPETAITTDEIADLESSELRDIQPLAPPPSQAGRQSRRPVLSAHTRDAPDRQANRDALDGVAADTPLTPQVRREIASLKARLDQQKREYSEMPRVLRLTSASTRASDVAEYLRRWEEWVEEVGNRNYPREARRLHLFGDLSLAVTLLRDGSVESIEIVRSSGQRILDQAAVRIVRLASPFSPIPTHIEEDKVEIIRTWRFIPGNEFAGEGN